MAKKKTNYKTMKRRNFLKGAGAAALGAAAVSSFQHQQYQVDTWNGLHVLLLAKQVVLAKQ